MCIFVLCTVQKVGRRFGATFRKRDGHSRKEGFLDLRCERVGRESRGSLWFFPSCDGSLFLLESRASDLQHTENKTKSLHDSHFQYKYWRFHVDERTKREKACLIPIFSTAQHTQCMIHIFITNEQKSHVVPKRESMLDPHLRQETIIFSTLDMNCSLPLGFFTISSWHAVCVCVGERNKNRHLMQNGTEMLA